MVGRRGAWIVSLVLASLLGWLISPAAADDPSAPARGAASAWGYNGAGQLGNNTTINSSIPVAVNTSGTINGQPVTAISAGRSHTCAVAGGKAYCWGDNDNGQLGNNSTTDSPVPVAVDTAGAMTGTVTAISAGAAHSCAVAGGKAFCWGDNSYGGLGNNSTSPSLLPVAVDTSGVLTAPVTAISAGNAHTCATAGGKAYCWGNNKYGQLGNNTTTDSPVPVAVDTSGVLTGAVSTISAGNGVTCAVAGGAAFCWGDNGSGQLGNNTTQESAVPVAVGATGTVTAISAGYSHTCATAGGKAYCWGSNTDGELGNGTTIGSKMPVAANTSGVLTGTVTAISAGTGFTCAVASGKAYCWGFNGYGELGNNTTTGSSVPVAVDASGVLTGTVTAISAGGLQTAALSISRYLSVSPTTLSFGSQRVGSSSPEQKVTITNSGAEDLTVSAVTLDGPDPAQFLQGSETCTGAPLAPNATCTVMVGFEPASAGGKTATVTVTSNAPGSPAVVTLSGTGSRKKQTLKPGLPKRIKLSGLTLITPADARTNAGQRVRTIVRGGPTKAAAAGQVRYFVVVRGPKGKVSVRTFGRTDLRLVVTQKAPATDGYTPFARSATYVAGKRR